MKTQSLFMPRKSADALYAILHYLHQRGQGTPHTEWLYRKLQPHVKNRSGWENFPMHGEYPAGKGIHAVGLRESMIPVTVGNMRVRVSWAGVRIYAITDTMLHTLGDLGMHIGGSPELSPRGDIDVLNRAVRSMLHPQTRYDFECYRGCLAGTFAGGVHFADGFPSVHEEPPTIAAQPEPPTVDTEALKSYLESLATKEVASDNSDFSADDYSGGNYDDAFSLGVDSGGKWTAQEILQKFFTQKT